jgi:hypothetical protein
MRKNNEGVSTLMHSYKLERGRALKPGWALITTYFNEQACIEVADVTSFNSLRALRPGTFDRKLSDQEPFEITLSPQALYYTPFHKYYNPISLHRHLKPMSERPPWNTSRGGRRFRIGVPQAPTVRSRLPMPARPQTRDERIPETTTESPTPDNGQITGAGTPSQDEIEIEHPGSGMEQLVVALNLVGTNRYDVISSQLATLLETITVQLQAQEQNAGARTDTLRETFDSASTRLEAAVVPINASIKGIAQRLDQRIGQNDKTLKDIDKDLADIRKMQKELESKFQKQKDKLDALCRGVQNVLLTTDRSLGEVGGIGQNFFMWLWKELVISPRDFLVNRSPNQLGFLYTKAF